VPGAEPLARDASAVPLPAGAFVEPVFGLADRAGDFLEVALPEPLDLVALDLADLDFAEEAGRDEVAAFLVAAGFLVVFEPLAGALAVRDDDFFVVLEDAFLDVFLVDFLAVFLVDFDEGVALEDDFLAVFFFVFWQSSWWTSTKASPWKMTSWRSSSSSFSSSSKLTSSCSRPPSRECSRTTRDGPIQASSASAEAGHEERTGLEHVLARRMERATVGVCVLIVNTPRTGNGIEGNRLPRSWWPGSLDPQTRSAWRERGWHDETRIGSG